MHDYYTDSVIATCTHSFSLIPNIDFYTCIETIGFDNRHSLKETFYLHVLIITTIHRILTTFLYSYRVLKCLENLHFPKIVNNAKFTHTLNTCCWEKNFKLQVCNYTHAMAYSRRWTEAIISALFVFIPSRRVSSQATSSFLQPPSSALHAGLLV